MTRKQKEKAIKKLVYGMLWDSHKTMREQIEKVMKSGAIDIDSYDPANAPMILPKTIVAAIIRHEQHRYLATGTSYERSVKKNVRNIQYLL